MAKFKCAGRKRFHDDGTPYCSHEASHRWRGSCPSCGRWYDCEKIGADRQVVQEVTLASLKDVPSKPRLSMGIPEMDTVLGGGLPEGATVFISGPPGTGKSTLLLSCANNVAEHGDVIYASGEQNVSDIADIARRIRATNARVRILGMEGDIYEIMRRVEEMEPKLLVIDSLATAVVSDCKADAGSAEQCKAVVNVLTEFLKKTKTACLVVCHINKEGDLAGPKAVEHLVDGVLEFDPILAEDGTSFTDLRKLTSGLKNRLGASNVSEVFEMTAEGIKPVQKKSKFDKDASGDDDDRPKKRKGPPRLFPVR